jgi:nicotinamidase/pyrazinamidase
MKTLIIIDVQNDFLPGGALAVPDSDAIIPVINEIQNKFDLVVATQDWHPPDHKSFASSHKGKKVSEIIDLDGIEQVLWPDHCVTGSKGAKFHPDLNMNRVEAIFRKGTDPNIDSYSGFFDNGYRRSTGLSGYLKDKGANDLYFCGLAADICVFFTLIDALKEGYKVTLLLDATRPLNEEEFSKQVETLVARGAKIQKSEKLIEAG